MKPIELPKGKISSVEIQVNLLLITLKIVWVPEEKKAKANKPKKK